MGKHEAADRYHARAFKQITFRLSLKNDADVIAWIEAQPNKPEAIRRLIRAEISEKEKPSE